MMVYDNYFCFLDYSERSDESSDESVYRLNIGKIETGEKLFRKHLGWSARLLTVSGKILLYEANQNCVLFNLDKFEVIKSYTPEYLQLTYLELTLGIESSSIEKYDNFGNDYYVIKITSKDGKIWNLDPLTGKFVTSVPDNKSFTKYLLSSKTEISIFKDIKEKYGEYFMQFSRETGNSIRRKLIIGKDTTGIDFIDPNFMEIFPDLEIVIIKSYTTTDKTNFYISAVDFKGKILWQQSRDDLKGSDYFSNNPDFDIALRYNNKLLFNSGGFVYYLDVLKDSVVWKTRF